MPAPAPTAAPRPTAPRIAEFAAVRLLRAASLAGVTFPAGTRGIVVEVHGAGTAYEVEFSQPAQMVLTIAADDLARA